MRDPPPELRPFLAIPRLLERSHDSALATWWLEDQLAGVQSLTRDQLRWFVEITLLTYFPVPLPMPVYYTPGNDWTDWL